MHRQLPDIIIEAIYTKKKCKYSKLINNEAIDKPMSI